MRYCSNEYFISHDFQSNDGMLTRLQLLSMARDVSAGMNYLAEIKFVHRVTYLFFWRLCM